MVKKKGQRAKGKKKRPTYIEKHAGLTQITCRGGAEDDVSMAGTPQRTFHSDHIPIIQFNNFYPERMSDVRPVTIGLSSLHYVH